MISQSVTDDNVPVVVSTRSASSEGIRLTHEARIVRRYSSATDFSCHATSSSTSGPCLVRRGRLTFPSDHTVQIGHGDGIIIQRFEEPEDAGPSTALAHTRVTSAQEQNESMRELELSQVDVIHEAESTLDEIDDESLMQVLHDSQNVEQVNDLPIDVDLGHQSPSCALGIEIQVKMNRMVFNSIQMLQRFSLASHFRNGHKSLKRFITHGILRLFHGKPKRGLLSS